MRSDTYAAQMRALVAARQGPLSTNSTSSLTESVDAYRFARIQMQAATSRHGSTRAQSCPRREVKHCLGTALSITGQICHGLSTVERNGQDVARVVSDCLTSHVSRPIVSRSDVAQGHRMNLMLVGQ
jgi:hypothetical protein